MRNIFYCLMGLALFSLFSCRGVSEKVSRVREATKTVKNATKMAKSSKGMFEQMEKLGELDPISTADFKAWTPKKILGFKRTTYKAGDQSGMGISSMNATFQEEEKEQRISLEVVDGAGGMATMLIGAYLGMINMDLDEENEDGYKKTVEKNGLKAVEEYKKGNATIETMVDDRFYIKAEGENMSPKELWEAVDVLKLNKLGK